MYKSIAGHTRDLANVFAFAATPEEVEAMEKLLGKAFKDMDKNTKFDFVSTVNSDIMLQPKVKKLFEGLTTDAQKAEKILEITHSRSADFGAKLRKLFLPFAAGAALLVPAAAHAQSVFVKTPEALKEFVVKNHSDSQKINDAIGQFENTLGEKGLSKNQRSQEVLDALEGIPDNVLKTVMNTKVMQKMNPAA